MSTIASPREPSAPLPRRLPSSQNTSTTPTSSSRPSLENSRSVTSSPNPSTGALSGTAAKRNRAALREYYNLKKGGADTPPTVEVTDPLGEAHPYSEVAPSEMDAPGFDAAAFVERTLQVHGLEELLRTYARVLGEIRALDAEKKGLVYDNYSRLIAATETIRKVICGPPGCTSQGMLTPAGQMRANMDPLNPMASTLDPAIAQIYAQASSIREELRQSVPPPDGEEVKQTARRKRTHELAQEVLATPGRIRKLVEQGKEEEARQVWEMPRRLLQTWKKQGVGGDDVDDCIADGDAALNSGKDEDSGQSDEADE
jgi:vacuolar protein sorting-associated protein 51